MKFGRTRLRLGVVIVVWLSSVVPAATAVPIDASWIWGSSRAHEKAATGRCDFRRRFQLETVEDATLRIACDDRFVLRINGRLVGIGSNARQWRAFDVRPMLRPGDNELFVRCRNDGGAAGLVLQLDLKTQSKVTRRIVTDDRWEARVQLDGTWDPGIVDRTPWNAAKVLGSFDDTLPWRGLVVAETKVEQVPRRSRLYGQPFELSSGDRVLFVGGTFFERAQRYGYLESTLTAAFPGQEIVFRNLGWSGDTVFGHARARFGTVADGFEQLETLVFLEKPTVIFVAYGNNESFGGRKLLDVFTRGMNDLLDVLSTTGAYLVLVTPTRHENLGAPLPDPASHNRDVEIYRNRILKIAKARSCGVVDLFERLPKLVDEYGDTEPLTDNGMHFGARGYWYIAQSMLEELEVPRSHVQVAINVSNGIQQSVDTIVANMVSTPRQLRFNKRDSRMSIPRPESSSESNKGASAKAATATGWKLQIKGLAPGDYELTMDGQPIMSANAEDWAAGRMVVSETHQDRADELLRLVCKKNELYFHRWRPQNETYLLLFRKHEQGNNAVEIPMFDPLIKSTEQQILPLSQPVNRTIEITRIAR